MPASCTVFCMLSSILHQVFCDPDTESVLPLLVTLYDSRLLTPYPIIDSLKLCPQFNADAYYRASLNASLFMLYFKRYLSGRGHVYSKEMRATSLLDTKTVRKNWHNTTLRAELFLKAVSGHSLLPVADSLIIEACFQPSYLCNPILTLCIDSFLRRRISCCC